MAEPLFWLGLSTFLVAVSLAAVLVAALPAFLELARAARSAEKLFDTLNRDLPPTLEAIRLTGIEITHLSGNVGQNVQAAGRVVGQLDQGITGVKQQARQVQIATQSAAVGLRAAWQTFRQTSSAAARATLRQTADQADQVDEVDDDLQSAIAQLGTARYADIRPDIQPDIQPDAQPFTAPPQLDTSRSLPLTENVRPGSTRSEVRAE